MNQKNFLEIIPQNGGYAGWIKADCGRRVQIISPTATAAGVRAVFEGLAEDPQGLIDRLNEAWAVQGLTFNNLTPALAGKGRER